MTSPVAAIGDSAAAPLMSRDLNQTIDDAPWSPYQKVMLGALAMVFAVDGIANQSLGLVMPALKVDWQVTNDALAPVAAANLAGVALGSIIGGMLGDRIGRRWALIGAVILFGLMTAAGAFTHDALQLMAVRFIDGLGIGAAIPNGAALISELTPSRSRGRAIAIGMVFIPVGGIMAGALGAWLLDMFGWQTLLIVAGLLPLALSIAFLAILPESPSLLLRGGQQERLNGLLNRCGIGTLPDDRFKLAQDDTARLAPLRVLLAPSLRSQTLLLWGGFFTCLMASYTIFSWVPTMLHMLGFKLGMSSLGLTTFHVGGAAGALFSGVLLDRKGFSTTHMRMAGAATLLAVALGVVLHANIVSIGLILPIMLALGFCMSGLHNTLYTLAASTYPASARATGVGVAAATGRLGAVLSSFTGVISLDIGGPLGFFGLIALLLALCGGAGWVARSQTRAA